MTGARVCILSVYNLDGELIETRPADAICAGISRRIAGCRHYRYSDETFFVHDFRAFQRNFYRNVEPIVITSYLSSPSTTIQL